MKYNGMKAGLAALLAAALLAGCAGMGGGSSQPPQASSAGQGDASSQVTSSQNTPSQQASSQPEASSQAASKPTSSRPASSQTASKPVASKPPVSSAPTKPPKYETGNDTGDAVKGNYYNNTVTPYKSGNVTVCGDYALEIFGGAGSKAYSTAVTQFAEKFPNVKVSCGIIPISSAFNAPPQYENQYATQQKAIQTMYGNMGGKVNTIDILGALTPHKGEYMYYRTDHHWTSLGAYYAYTAYMNSIGTAPNPLSGYQTVKTTGYLGSLYSFCVKPKPASLKTNLDYTIGRLPHVGYTLTYGSTWDPTVKGTAVNPNAVGYLMFINGDQPVTKIVTENKNGRKLVVFKESFGNAVVPYLIDHFEEIYVIDIRQTTPSVASLIKTKGITDALILNYVMGASGGHVNVLQKKLAS